MVAGLPIRSDGKGSMSFAEFLSGIETGAYTADTESAIVGGAIRYGVQNNISGAEILRGLQGAGLGVRRQTFYQLVRNERANIAAGFLPADVSLVEVPGAETIPTVAVGRAGTYVSNIRLTYRVADGAGNYHLEERTLSVTSRSPMAPSDAMQIAQDIWAEHSVNYPNLQIFDLAYMGTVLHTGKA